MIDKSQHFNKHNIQSRRTRETLLNQTFQYNCSPKTEPKVAKKFKTILSNPIQIWLSRNYKIQAHQNTSMRQDLNPRSCSISGNFLGMWKTRRYTIPHEKHKTKAPSVDSASSNNAGLVGFETKLALYKKCFFQLCALATKTKQVVTDLRQKVKTGPVCPGLATID